jgi:hypothetical protein
MTYSPLPRADLVPVHGPLACGDAELAAVLGLVRRIRPRPVSVIVGTAMDPISRANGDRVAQAWSREDGCVLATVRWPETAASWLRQARRFADPEPDAWVVSATPAGWIGMGRRLACSTGWAPGRTVATAGLADPALIAAGGIGTFDGLRGAFSDGSTWEIARTLLITDRRN